MIHEYPYVCEDCGYCAVGRESHDCTYENVYSSKDGKGKVDWFVVVIDSIFYAMITAILIFIGVEMGLWGLVFVPIVLVRTAITRIEDYRFGQRGYDDS